MRNHAQQALPGRRLLCTLLAALGVAASAPGHSQAGARLHQHRGFIHRLSVRNRRGRELRPPQRQFQDTEDRADRQRRRYQGVLRRCRRRASGHRELLAANHGGRGGRLRQERRHGHRRGQDRLRRHRARQRQSLAALSTDAARGLPRAREGRAGSRRRQQARAESLHEVVRDQRVAAGRRHRRSRAAPDIGYARRVQRARDGGRLQDVRLGCGIAARRVPHRLPHVARRRPLHRCRRERQPHRAEAREQPTPARHLRLQLPRAECGQGPGRAHQRCPAGLRFDRGQASIPCRGHCSST